MPTQEEYNVSKQSKRELDVVIQLLNKNFQTVDELSGVTIDTPNYSISSESGIRRTLSLSLYVKDSSFEIADGNKIWLDKYVKVLVGIKDLKTKEFVYTNIGIYLINNPSHMYNATTNTLTLSCVDLMAKFTGDRDGNFTVGYDYLIEAGTNIRDAFISILAENGFDLYIIEDVSQTVPNDIRLSANSNFYALMYELLTILPRYQIYFDVEGVFHYEQIPINENVTVVADDDIFQTLLIEYNKTTNFEYVKNVVTVVGATHDVSNYGGISTFSDNIYSIDLSGITAYNQLYKIGFTTSDYCDTPYLNINNLGVKTIKKENGDIPEMQEGIYYVLTYIEDEDYFQFLGEVTPMYTAKDTDNDSQFNVDKLGEIGIVYMGGEYENITTDDLAKERAIWELYHSTRLQEVVTLTVVPIYWLDVNTVVEITLPNKNYETTSNQYIINSISTTIGISGTQTITMSPYYAYYIE